ncbi:MAG: hypothetical protein ABR572_09390 [Cryomorphaceae bacterium]
MRTNHFLTFQKFSDKEDALMLKESLEKEGIQTVMENTSAGVDITFSGNTHGNEFLLKINHDAFQKANAVLEKQAASIVDQFTDDHYLFEFSDEELFELIERPDEWSKEDFLLAVRILKDRGHELSNSEIREIRENGLRDIRTPEPGKPAWIIVGYATAVAGGLIGLLIGWTHWKSTKIDPTGKRFYIYDEETRKSGRNIFWIAVVFTAFFVVRYFLML